MEYTKYAAVGHFKCHRTLAGKKYPVVIVGQKEYMLDVQEMTVWSSLAWRILSRSQIAEAYLKLTRWGENHFSHEGDCVLEYIFTAGDKIVVNKVGGKPPDTR